MKDIAYSKRLPDVFLHSSSTFPPTGLTPRIPAVFLFFFHMTCKIVPDMTYNVFGGTLNLAQSINLGHVGFNCGTVC